jgi:predicted aspartyl protease
VIATLKCNNPTISSIVQFIVDTGAATTSLGEDDLDLAGYKMEDLKEKNATRLKGIAGHLVDSSLLFDCSIVLGNNEVKLERITVVKNENPTSLHESVLGMDVLRDYEISFTDTKVILKRQKIPSAAN